jgi:hypothetical protein
MAKRMCFREQVEWAAAQHCIHLAHGYLNGLAPAAWPYGS